MSKSISYVSYNKKALRTQRNNSIFTITTCNGCLSDMPGFKNWSSTFPDARCFSSCNYWHEIIAYKFSGKYSNNTKNRIMKINKVLCIIHQDPRYPQGKKRMSNQIKTRLPTQKKLAIVSYGFFVNMWRFNGLDFSPSIHQRSCQTVWISWEITQTSPIVACYRLLIFLSC